MRLTSLLTCLILLSTGARTQNLKAVIEVEKAFAAYAEKYNTRDAFLLYIDSNAVVFDKGEILSAKQVWTADTSSGGKLLWKPAFAGIAASGDLAFTTGPWEYKFSLSDTTVASGQFATIWRKTSAGEWKFLVDLGISTKQTMSIYKNISEAGKGTRSVADSGLPLELEEKINQQFTKEGPSALINISDPACWYIVQGELPLKGLKEVKQKALAITPSQIVFTPAEAGIASSGDLAYAYGYAAYNNKKENYLRIWKNTKHGWKMLLLLIK